MNLIRRPWRHLRMMWLASPGWTLVNAGVTALYPVATLATLLGTQRTVDRITHGASLDKTALWLGVALAGMAFSAIAPGVVTVFERALGARYLATVHVLIADTALAPHGIGHLEDPELLAPLTTLAAEARSYTGLFGVKGFWQVLQYRLYATTALAVLLWWNPLAALLVLAAQRVFSSGLRSYIHALGSDLFGAASGPRAQADYYRRLLSGPDAAKEVRLFGLTSWALERHTALWHQAMRPGWALRERHLRRSVWGSLALLVAYSLACWWLVRDAVAGTVSLGALLMLLQALERMELWGPLGDNQSYAERQQLQLEQLDGVRRGLGLTPVGARPAPQPAPDPAARRGRPAGIDIEHLTFTYPSRTRPVFEDLSLHVPAGQSVAVVGVNGAGKSTLIKLLTGLHAPDAGTVRIDGADPGTDDAARRRVAVIFQEFVRYQLSLLDNVTLALPPGTPETTRADVAARALHDAAGDAVLARVGSWDTTLSAQYAGGTDLSGGQWQRVALARALAAVDTGAGVLVLDEPTAALDVRAEAALFRDFLQVTRGVTTILVSHRLSSVRHASRIVVLDSGRVVEDGSHEELMALDGAYAAAFRLQASRFEEAGTHA